MQLEIICIRVIMFKRLIEFENNKLHVEGHSKLEDDFWDLYASRKWEYDYLNFMLANRHGRVFLDVGSWIGPVSLLMAGYYDKVVSVDLDPVANESFKRNLEINNIKNVELYELGFSNKADKVKVNTDSLGSSMTSLYGKLSQDTVEVKVMRFDDFIEQSTFKNEIGFIKIDCEGAEYKFLSQVYNFLTKHHAKVIISYHPFVIKKPRYYFVKIFHWLMQLRFRRFYFTKKGLIVKEPFHPLFKLGDNLPMADVLEH